MTDVFIDLSGELQMSAATKLRHTLEEIDKDTTLNIIIDANDENHAATIYSILERYKMVSLPKGSEDGRTIQIIAHNKESVK